VATHAIALGATQGSAAAPEQAAIVSTVVVTYKDAGGAAQQPIVATASVIVQPDRGRVHGTLERKRARAAAAASDNQMVAPVRDEG
jgi:hypothetical protein